jgi:hypothetical protein
VSDALDLSKLTPAERRALVRALAKLIAEQEREERRLDKLRGEGR